MKSRRTLQGVAVRDAAGKTVVVEVVRSARHAFYEKVMRHAKRYKAHDETNDAKTGDRVVIAESRPRSGDKRWVLQSVVARAPKTLREPLPGETAPPERRGAKKRSAKAAAASGGKPQ